MSSTNHIRNLLGAVGVAACTLASPAAAQPDISSTHIPGTSFTYQGVLSSAGTNVDASVMVDFKLFNAAAAGTQVGSTISSAVTPVDGVFSQSLDFGAVAYGPNQSLWLEITVDGDVLGRQELEATPFSLNTRGITIDDSGKMGLGIANPERGLHIRDSFAGSIMLDRSDFPPVILFRDYLDLDDDFSEPPTSSWFVNAGITGFGVYDNTDGPSLKRVHIGSTGNVGIGTISPATKLDVNGTATMNGLDVLALSTLDTLHVNGNVGIGTTTPTSPLDVTGTARADTVLSRNEMFLGNIASIEQGLHISTLNGRWEVGSNDSGNFGGNNQFYIYNKTATGNNYMLTIAENNPYVGINTVSPQTTLDVNGNIRCVSLTQTSAKMYKDDIEPIQNALETIDQLQGVSYTWNDLAPEEARGNADLGFIAGDVAMILPELVAFDENGDAAGIDYGKITSVTVEAIKELKAENDDLRSRLDRMEAMLEAQNTAK